MSGGRSVTIWNSNQCQTLLNILNANHFKPQTEEQKEVYERLKMGCPYTPDKSKRRTQRIKS